MAAAGTQATFLRQRSATGSRAVRRWRIAAVAVVVLSATACGGRTQEPASDATPCAAENQRYCAAAEGDLLDVTLDVLHPTQPSLGYDEVYSRLGRYTIGKDASDQLFDAWCTGRTGFPLVDLKVTLTDGDVHDTDSNELAFRFAASDALRREAPPLRRARWWPDAPAEGESGVRWHAPTGHAMAASDCVAMAATDARSKVTSTSPAFTC